MEPLPASLPGTRYVSQLPAAPPRPDDAHKGTFGSVLIVAGSEGMGGAACLAGRAALHGGAGLVTVAIPRCVSTIVAIGNASYMTLPLADHDGHLGAGAIPTLDERIKKYTAVAIGPGLGQSIGVQAVVRHVFANCAAPLVLDADGLNALTHGANLDAGSRAAPRILTPHPGEFSRLTGLDVATIQSHRERHAVDFAREHHVILLLKGPRTVITDGERLAINTTGNSALATGGTGDVLTGVIVALLAQGMDAFEAAQLGAHLHGLAGDLMAARYTPQFATSSELVDQLDAAWRCLV